MKPTAIAATLIALATFAIPVLAGPTQFIAYTYTTGFSSGKVICRAGVAPHDGTVTVWFYGRASGSSNGQWSPRHDMGPAEEEVEVVDSIEGFEPDTPVTLWSGASDGFETIWSPPQNTTPSLEATSPKIVCSLLDGITEHSARVRFVVSTFGSASTLNIWWRPNSYFELPSTLTISISEAVTETLITVVPQKLFPFVSFSIGASVVHDAAPTVRGTANTQEFTTLYDSTVKSLTVPLAIKAAVVPVRRNLTFGVHSYAGLCLDGPLGERELPPLPPEFEVRFVDSRPGSGPCLLTGSYVDMRPYVSESQTDTFRILISTVESFLPAEFSWPELDSLYTGPVIFHTMEGDVDMKAARGFTLTNPDITWALIYATGPRARTATPEFLPGANIAVTATTAHLNSLIYPNGKGGSAWYEWGESVSYGDVTAQQAVPASFTSHELPADLTGLAPSTEYHFRVMFETDAGEAVGSDQVFMTGSITAADDDSGELPDRIWLSQNYPNPFNPVTSLRYSLPRGGRAELGIYDITGRELMTLVDRVESPGIHTVVFSVENLATGVYLCRLTADGSSLVRKIAVIR